MSKLVSATQWCTGLNGSQGVANLPFHGAATGSSRRVPNVPQVVVAGVGPWGEPQQEPDVLRRLAGLPVDEHRVGRGEAPC